MIKWADDIFKYYILYEGAKPTKKFGVEYAKHELQMWKKHLLAYIIGGIMLISMIVVIDNISRTKALFSICILWSIIVAVDFLISISYFIWKRT